MDRFCRSASRPTSTLHLNNVNIQGQEHGLWSQQSADMAVSHDALVQRIRVISNDTVGQVERSNDAGVASGTFLETGDEQLFSFCSAN